MLKEVKHLIPASDINMGGIIVKQALPTNNVPNVDPYLLLHHADFKFRNDAPAMHQGIGPHPHRGFSPVTFVIDGEVHHRDSRGNDQIAKKGEVQWMHAGMGIIHSERPSQNLIDKKGNQEIIQLWINSPAAKKLSQPLYQFREKDAIVAFDSLDQKITNKLVAGKVDGHIGNIKTESEIIVLWSEGKEDGVCIYTIPESHNTMIYIIKGSIKIKGYGGVDAKNLCVFSQIGTQIEINTQSETQYLILSGVPLQEKIVQHGPFVMNSQTQIMEAMRDYQMGKMGVLIEDQVSTQ